MAKPTVKRQGTREKPWLLKTPSGQSEFKAYRDESLNPSAVVVLVGKTELRYHLRCLRLVRAQEGSSGAVRQIRPTCDGSIGLG